MDIPVPHIRREDIAALLLPQINEIIAKVVQPVPHDTDYEQIVEAFQPGPSDEHDSGTESEV